MKPATHCPTGKAVITSFELAEKARKRSNKKHGKPMSKYRRAICGALHLGAPSRAKKPLKTINNNHELRFS